MSEWKKYALACLGSFLMGLLVPVMVANQREGRLKAQIEYASKAALAAQQEIDILREHNLCLDADNERLTRLSLALIDSIKSNADDYEHFAPLLAHADAAELHQYADSLLAGYAVNRERYRMLLRARSPGTP